MHEGDNIWQARSGVGRRFASHIAPKEHRYEAKEQKHSYCLLAALGATREIRRLIEKFAE